MARSQITNVGERRSEKYETPKGGGPVDTGFKHSGHPEESIDFPGYKVAIVPKDDAEGTIRNSPTSMFGRQGYDILTDDPVYTGDSQHQIMGKRIDRWQSDETARIASHNAGFVDGYVRDVESELGDRDPMKFLKEVVLPGGQKLRSGVSHGSRMQVPVHATLQQMTGQAAPEE